MKEEKNPTSKNTYPLQEISLKSWGNNEPLVKMQRSQNPKTVKAWGANWVLKREKILYQGSAALSLLNTGGNHEVDYLKVLQGVNDGGLWKEQKKIGQSLILPVVPLKKMKEICNVYHRYTSAVLMPPFWTGSLWKRHLSTPKTVRW